MLSLTKELEHEFEFNGTRLDADLSFDNVLRWYELIEDKNISEEDKITIGFEMFFKACSWNFDLVIGSIKSVSEYIAERPYTASGGDTDKYYSFEQDAEAIYSSFLEQYGIDLINEQGKLHWDKFIALLFGLNEKTYFKRIIEIRTKDISELKGKALTSVIEAQEYYRLNDSSSVEAQNQRMNDVFAALKAEAERR